MASDFRLKEQLPALTEEIVATYTPDDAINHLGHCQLPSYTAVTEILLDLKDILYPGYRRKVGLHSGNIRYHVGGLIDSLHDQLTTQIARALRHEDRVERNHSDCESDIDFEAKGQAMAIELLKRIPDLRRTLATDVQAARPYRRAPGAGPANRRDPDHVQRGQHATGDGASGSPQGSVREDPWRSPGLHELLRQGSGGRAQALPRGQCLHRGQ